MQSSQLFGGFPPIDIKITIEIEIRPDADQSFKTSTKLALCGRAMSTTFLMFQILNDMSEHCCTCLPVFLKS